MGAQNRGGADQTATLDDILDNVASAKGRELGNMILPPGIIKVATNWLIYEQRGIKVAGVAATAAQDGPRNHGGWTNFMTGTSLYWAGASGGTVITLQRTREVWLEDLDVFLGESSTANHASIGILHQNPDGFGNGGNSLRNVAIVAPAHGGIGLQFSTTSGQNNNDTFYADHLMLWNLATGIKLVSDNALDYCLTSAHVYNTDTFVDADHGGHIWVFGSFMVDARDSQNLTILRVGTGGSNAASYRLDGFHVDRQGDYQHVTVFDTHSAADTCIASCSCVFLRTMTVPAAYNAFDGTKPASFEVGNRNIINASGCNLQDQPLVRFRGVPSSDRAPVVQLDSCIVPHGYALGGEVVTCHEGGCAGPVILNNCQRVHEILNATVGQMAGPGNASTHEDETEDSNFDIAPRGYDAWPSSGATNELEQFYDPDKNNDGSNIPAGSWLGMTYKHTGYLVAYWRLDEPLQSTTLKDISGSGRDLVLDASLDTDVQVVDSPLPYLERCANWSNKNDVIGPPQSRRILDTGIDADPKVDSLTLFGFAKPNVTANQVMFGIDPGANPRLWIGSLYTDGNMLITRSNGGGSSVGNFLSAVGHWFHFVFTWDAGTKKIKAFINGIRQLDATNGGLDDISPGAIVFGGDSVGGGRAFQGRFSRVGILKGRVLSDKEATLLFLRASTSLAKGYFRPT